MFLRIESHLAILVHGPGVTVLPQVWQWFLLGTNLEGLFTDTSKPAIVESLVLLFTARRSHSVYRSLPSRSAHIISTSANEMACRSSSRLLLIYRSFLIEPSLHCLYGFFVSSSTGRARHVPFTFARIPTSPESLLRVR